MISSSPSSQGVSGALALPHSSANLSSSNSLSDRLHSSSENSGTSIRNGNGGGSSSSLYSSSSGGNSVSASASSNGTGVPFVYSHRGHPNFNPTKPVVPIPRPMVRKMKKSFYNLLKFFFIFKKQESSPRAKGKGEGGPKVGKNRKVSLFIIVKLFLIKHFYPICFL